MGNLKYNLDLVTLGYIILSCNVGTIYTLKNNFISEPQNSTEPIADKVEVYRCPTSKLQTGQKLKVPSFTFDDQNVTLQVKKERFPGCDRYGVQPVSTHLWWQNRDEEIDTLDIEVNHTSITPTGVLSVKDHFYFPDEYCIQSETRFGKKHPIITFQYCPVNCSSPLSKAEIRRPCVQKCCPFGKSIEVVTSDPDGPYPTGCVITKEAPWKGFFYDDYTWKRLSESDMMAKKVKPHFFRKLLNCKELKNDTEKFFWYTRNLNTSVHDRQLVKLLTDGRILFISPKRRWEPLKNEANICIDGLEDPDQDLFYVGREEDQVIAICEDISPKSSTKAISTLYMGCLFGASVFYFLTAIVYGLLWDKHNTHGWTVFSLVTSLFFMVVFLGNAHRLGLNGNPELRGSNICIANAILAHFFMLSSFTWLSLISFDMWWTFRELKVRNNSKSLKKFFFYCIVGIGLPLIIVIVGNVLEKLYPERESLVLIPEYGDNLCFVASWAQGAYIYYIIACLLAINVILTIMTFSKLYGFQRDTSGVRSQSSAGDRKMIVVYLKLLVILGTSWIFEYISWQASEDNHQHWIWTVFDIYNLCTAFFIFIIFVCKEITLNQLEEKYSIFTPLMNGLRKVKLLKQPESSKSPDSSGKGTGSTSTAGEYKLKPMGTDNYKGLKNSPEADATGANTVTK